MTEAANITILMATYNGSAYLERQLDSILNQSYPHWELIIRDDQSTDQTVQLIEKYKALDSRINIIHAGSAYGSACSNFSALFDWAFQNHKTCIMFADQDDIWLPNKIEVSLKHLQQQQLKYGLETPLLSYGNLSFIDDQDQPIKADLPLPSSLHLETLMNENYAWGCTMIMNEAAIKLINHIPIDAVNHDYYVALVVSAFGKVNLIEDHLILYRQHAQNVSGNVEKMSFSSRINRYIKDTDYMLKPLIDNYKLVQSFYQTYQGRLNSKQQQMINGFLIAYYKGFFPLLFTMFKYRILKIGTGKNLVYFYTLFLLRKKVIQNVIEKE